MKGKWKDIETDPPKKDGRYLVSFYFKYRHPCDCTEGGYRELKNGIWTRPYYSRPDEGSELYQWWDEDAE